MRFSLAILILAAGSLLSQTPSDCKSGMQQGVKALISRHYDDAVVAFERAGELAPTAVAPRISLAEALMPQYDPRSSSKENRAIAKRCYEEYLHVTRLDPKNPMVVVSIGVLLFGQASGAVDEQERTRLLEESRDWYRKAVALDPMSRQTWYAMTRLAWSRWYPDYQGQLFR